MAVSLPDTYNARFLVFLTSADW